METTVVGRRDRESFHKTGCHYVPEGMETRVVAAVRKRWEEGGRMRFIEWKSKLEKIHGHEMKWSGHPYAPLVCLKCGLRKQVTVGQKKDMQNTSFKHLTPKYLEPSES